MSEFAVEYSIGLVVSFETPVANVINHLVAKPAT